MLFSDSKQVFILQIYIGVSKTLYLDTSYTHLILESQNAYVHCIHQLYKCIGQQSRLWCRNWT